MSTLAMKNPTLADWAKTRDPNGKTAKIVEMLSQTNEILNDMVYVPGNLATGHRTTIRTGLPDVYWRRLNKGVPSSKSRSVQVDEAVAMLEARSSVDKEIAILEDDLNAYRLSEATPFMDAMSQEMASTLFYGNSGVVPEEFSGLATRYSSKSAANGDNIVLGGGSGTDNTSIWLICWGKDTVHGIFPKGSKAGLIHENLGEGDEFDADRNRFRAYMDLWQWKTGLVVRDWRYAVRIPNIDISALIANDSTSANLTNLMTMAVHRIPALGMGKCAFYMNRTVAQYLDIQRNEAVKDGGGITYQNVDGKNILSFRGIPIRSTDAILENEALVS